MLKNKIPNMFEICRELNNKANIIFHLNKIHIAKCDIDKDKLNQELEKKHKIHQENLDKIIEKYYLLLKKFENETKSREEVIIIFKEVLFSIKLIDICIGNINKNLINNISIYLIYEIIEFTDVFIINHIIDEYDFCLDIKSFNVQLLFEKIKKIFGIFLSKNKKSIVINVYDDDLTIYADEFKLFYVLTHILFYIIENNPDTNLITIFIENKVDNYTKNLYIKFVYINLSKTFETNNNKNGLCISNKIIIAHNGSLSYNKNKCKENELIEITVYIPIINSSEILSKKNLKKSIESIENMQKLQENIKTNSNNSIEFDIINNIKIVCVDDSKMNIKFLSRIIACQFFNNDVKKIQVFENGCELINRILEYEKYNIIFLDNNMPNLKGSAVTKILRSLGCNSFIIGVTGDNIDINNNEFLNNGANIVYKKPFKKKRH